MADIHDVAQDAQRRGADELPARDQVLNAIHRMFMAVDTQDWGVVRACLTDQVVIDYSSLTGLAAATLEADDQVAGWRAAMSGYHATQHLISNHIVLLARDTAVCLAAFQAQHYLPNDRGESFWTLGGRYRFDLAYTSGGWRLHGIVMTASWARGNQQLPSLATQQTR